MRRGESMMVNVSRNRGWRRLVAVVAALAVVAPVVAVGTATAGADPVETFVVGAATRSIDPTVGSWVAWRRSGSAAGAAAAARQPAACVL